MARRNPTTSLRQISEINLTPIMDLTFILLITFIITFPLVEQGIPVNLPRGKAKTLKADTAESVTVDAEGRIFLNMLALTPEEFRDRMTDLGRKDAGVTVMVRADERVAYGEVVKVLRILHDAGISKMTIVTRGDVR